jgi:hypothetical protein
VIVARAIRSGDGFQIGSTVRSMLGAAPTRQQTHPPSSADALADIELLDQDSEPVRLGDLWRDGPVALVWLRHYG